jgi:hypothetical protein
MNISAVAKEVISELANFDHFFCVVFENLITTLLDYEMQTT